MKILQVIHSLNPHAGGTTEGLKQLSAALIRQGVSVDVLSLDASDAPWVRNFPLPLFTLGPGRTHYGYSSRVIPWLIEHAAEYDMVIVNGLWQFGSFAVWRASRKTGLPYAVFPHGMLDPWFKRHYPVKHLKKWLYWPWAEYWVLRHAAAVLFTSEEERLDARESFWLYRCREEVVGFGIAPPPTEENSPPEIFFKAYPHLAHKRLLLFIGRLHEKKGCDLLLRAFRTLRSRASPQFSDIHLVMAGPYDTPYGAQMRALAQELKLDADVTWTGMLSGDLKWSAFRAAETSILPSHQENFGVSVAEALACGRAVLVSNRVNIWREIVSDHAGLVENDDLPGTVRLMESWLELEPVAREGLHHGAQVCYERRFQMTTVAKRLIVLFENLRLEGEGSVKMAQRKSEF
jgi:glycosyltransferase involved in cell wall biosynthesis